MGSGQGTALGRWRSHADEMRQQKLTIYEIDTRGTGHTISAKDVREDIHRVADIVGGRPSFPEYEKWGSYSESAIRNKFGNWTSALQKLGYNPEHNQGYSDEEVLDELRRVAELVGQPPARRHFKEHGQMSKNTVYNHFSSWKEALEKAGMEPGRRGGEWVPLGDLIDEMLAVAAEVDRPPYGRDMNEHGEYSDDLYKSRFGSWAEALRTCGLPPRFRGRRAGQYEREGVEYYGRNWKEQRQRALSRDRYRCQSCGSTIQELRDSDSTGLEVHHIIPIREFNEPEEANFVENLITLCERCHLEHEGDHPDVDVDILTRGGGGEF